MTIPALKWQWKPKQQWISVLITVFAIAASTLVAQCKSDGSITFETQPQAAPSGL